MSSAADDGCKARGHYSVHFAAGGVGDAKKALFLLYLEANSISLGADIAQYVIPEPRCTPGNRVT